MPSKPNPPRRSLASQADRYWYYQASVQAPDHEVRFVDRVFRREFGRRPLRLREDFCGTALVACEWVRTHPERQALGIDIDPEPLAWCRKHNFPALSPSQQARVELVPADVREVRAPVEVVAALNFSYFVFRSRSELGHYFEAAYRNLQSTGLLVLDLMGGPNCQRDDLREPTRKRGFTYLWHHERFDPITHETVCRIHFKFPDGSLLKNAFTYHWRLWTPPELCELLREVGFRRAEVYWEGTDRRTGEGNGVFRRQSTAQNDLSWIAYLIGVK